MSSARRAGIDFAALRRAISMQQVLRCLDYSPVLAHGNHLRGACPLHPIKDPRERSFSVDLRRGLFHCFHCGAHGNQLDLWVAHTRQPLYDAAVDLCRRHGISPPRRTTPPLLSQPPNPPLPATHPDNRQGH